MPPAAGAGRAAGRRRRPRQARSRATVAFVLEAAAQVFEERGYAATTNEIAARAGVSIGTLYQYFADKDALLVALAEQHLAAGRARIEEALAATPPDDPRALVRSVIEVVVDVNRPTGLHRLLHSTAPRTPELVAVLAGLRDALADVTAALLVARGVPATTAHRRGRALVVALDAVVHDHVLAAEDEADERDRIDDAVLLALATLDASIDRGRDETPAPHTGERYVVSPGVTRPDS